MAVNESTRTAAAARVERLREATAEAGLDAFVATADESIAYLTGFRPLQLERLFAVVVRADGGGAVVVPKLDAGQVAEAPDSLARVSYDASSDGIPELAELLDGAARVGVEEDHIVFARSTRTDEPRARARSGRRRHLRPAGAQGRGRDRGRSARVRAGRGRVRASCGRCSSRACPSASSTAGSSPSCATGARPTRIRSILFGENAANPHADPTDRVLREGDVVCADISACLDGYWGDLTRCATVGPPSDWALEVWALVRDAQAASIAACVPGTPARDVETAERVILETRPDLGEVLHGAGHAIGLAIHEPPFLVPRSGMPLAHGDDLHD